MIMGGEPTTVHLLMKEQTQKRLGFKVLNSFVLSITLVKVISGFVLFLFNFHLLMYFCRFFLNIVCDQCDQIGKFIGLWATFQSLWQQ